MADVGVLAIRGGVAYFGATAVPGIGWSITRTPIFQTRIQRAVSGRELRALDYPYPLWQWELLFNVLRDNPAIGFDELRSGAMGFFMLCQGAFGSFLFGDPDDFRVYGQPIGTGDGSTTAFQLIRTFGTGLPGGGFVEPIQAPNLTATAPSPTVYLNGVVQSPSAYSISAATGILTFVTAPGATVPISVDISFYFRCRFVDDSYSFENFMYRLWQLKKLTFISTRT
jgi:uncharacterized protein (TIGR02217 family)